MKKIVGIYISFMYTVLGVTGVLFAVRNILNINPFGKYAVRVEL